MADARRPRTKKSAPDAAAEPRAPLSAAALRRQAEERLSGLTEATALPASEELAAAVHELRVHQIELEMQNEELRGAERALEASRAKYFALFDLAPVGYVTLDHEGRIVEANLSAARLLGVERAQLLGQHLGGLVLKGDRDRYYLHLRSLSGEAARAACELRLARPPEELPWVRLESTTFASDDGGALHRRIIISDITESKQAEGELARHRQHLEHLVAERTDEISEADRVLAERAAEVTRSRQNFDAF